MEKLMFKSRTTEVDASSIRMIGTYKKTDLNTDSYLSTTFASLEAETNRLTKAIKRSKTESDLEYKDELRDEKVRALYFTLAGFCYNPNDTIKTAAETIAAIFNKYGLSITHQSYATESSLINSMLIDLEELDLEESINLLQGCPQLINELKSAQNDFEKSRISYQGNKGEEGIKDSATNIKKIVVALVNDQLVVYLRAMSLVNNAMYGEFTRTISEIIANNNKQVKKRSRRNSAV